MAKTQRHVGRAAAQLMLTALALVGLAGSALAQESTCESDTDCDHGYSCEVTGGEAGGCPGSPPCADERDCPPPPECDDTPTETKSCVPARDCAQDADCAEGWVCAMREAQDCTSVDIACPSDGECPKPEPETCEAVVERACVPRWLAPCEDASSCGAGFDCVEQSYEQCSGGGAGGADGSGDAFAPPQDAGVDTDPDPAEPPPPEDTCTTVNTGEHYCVLQETACSVDADCTAGLTCQVNQRRSDCTRPSEDPGQAPPAEGGGASEPIDAGAADPDLPDDEGATPLPLPCESDEPERVCAPEGYFEYGGGLRGDADEDGSATAGGDNGGDGEAAPQAPTGDDDTMEPPPGGGEESASMEADSGCRAAGHAPAGSLSLIALALAGLVLRRKQRA